MNFLIHNGSRATHNRTLRAQQPEHGGHKQYILDANHRLIRGRPLVVTEEKIKEHLSELKVKEGKGLLYVTTEQMIPVDLDTLQPSALPVPASPLPNPPLDSAKNDRLVGDPMLPNRGELPPPAEFTMPVGAPAAALENNPLVPAEGSDEELEALTAPTQQAQTGKRRGGR
jgi:hypothetical protein